ncbi:MAG TPA: acyl-CoA dehydrogenase family protein, partial [Chthoniobacterales bacterium]
MKAESETRNADTLPGGPVPPKEDVHRIKDDAEALEAARRVAAQIAEGSAERDRERRLPFAEVELLSQSGLWGITVPKAYGGPG